MDLILLKTVDKLGNEGDRVKVAEGYARNYLLPKKLALPYSEANRKAVEAGVKRREVKARLELQEAQALAEKMKDTSCTIAAKVGEDDKLYGSVTAQDIADALKQEGYDVDKKKILLGEPIKKIGVYPVEISLLAEVKTQVKVWVVKE